MFWSAFCFVTLLTPTDYTFLYSCPCGVPSHFEPGHGYMTSSGQWEISKCDASRGLISTCTLGLVLCNCLLLEPSYQAMKKFKQLRGESYMEDNKGPWLTAGPNWPTAWMSSWKWSSDPQWSLPNSATWSTDELSLSSPAQITDAWADEWLLF